MKTTPVTDFDVDIVVLWVDGNDIEWLTEKARYENKTVADYSNGANRFRDWGLMKYWFRSIEAYAPWARKIHFVTWGHLPPFLDTSCEKLHIVKHTDYMPEGSLPTYSSRALELNLHRIEGLAERFIFLNDDMFLGKPLEKSDFFDPKTGFPRMAFEEKPIRFIGDEAWHHTDATDVGIINRNFKKRDKRLSEYPGKYLSRSYLTKENVRSLALKLFCPEYYTGFKQFHSFSPLLKSTFEEVWEKEPELMMSSTMHRFRVSTDPNQWVLLYWQLVKGAFVPRSNNEKLFDVDSSMLPELCRTIGAHELTCFCINDPESLKDYEECADAIREAFEMTLPDKCIFEK